MADDDGPDGPPPIDDDERRLLQQDLLDVQTLKALLDPRGIKGAVFYCPDCNEDHYLTWDLLSGNLRELLDAGESPIHEPAYEPDPDDYVSWDYARGYLDGYETFKQEKYENLGDRLAAVLADHGLEPSDAKSVIARLDLPTDIPSDES